MSALSPETITAFRQLFRCNPAHFALSRATSKKRLGGKKQGGGTFYHQPKGELTDEMWLSHLSGEGGIKHKPRSDEPEYEYLNIVADPVMPDGTVTWFTIDVDLYNGELDDEEAGNLFKQLIVASEPKANKACLAPIVLRSKSGGAHMTVFCHEPIPASLAIKALNKMVKDYGLADLTNDEGKTCIELRPSKSTPASDGDKGGNRQLNLPYCGSNENSRVALSRFHDTKPGHPIPLSLDQFLRDARMMSHSLKDVDDYVNGVVPEVDNDLTPADLDEVWKDTPDDVQDCVAFLLNGQGNLPNCVAGRDDAIAKKIGPWLKAHRNGTWEDDIVELNNQAADPLSSREIGQKINSLRKKDYAEPKKKTRGQALDNSEIHFEMPMIKQPPIFRRGQSFDDMMAENDEHNRRLTQEVSDILNTKWLGSEKVRAAVSPEERMVRATGVSSAMGGCAFDGERIHAIDRPGPKGQSTKPLPNLGLDWHHTGTVKDTGGRALVKTNLVDFVKDKFVQFDGAVEDPSVTPGCFFHVKESTILNGDHGFHYNKYRPAVLRDPLIGAERNEVEENVISWLGLMLGEHLHWYLSLMNNLMHNPAERFPALLLTGPTRTGKSFCLSIAEHCVGEDNYAGIDSKTLFGLGRGSNFTGWKGKGVIGVEELSAKISQHNRDDVIEQCKIIFGLDSRQEQVEFKYGAQLQMRTRSTVIMCSNYSFPIAEPAVLKRIFPIECTPNRDAMLKASHWIDPTRRKAQEEGEVFGDGRAYSKRERYERDKRLSEKRWDMLVRYIYDYENPIHMLGLESVPETSATETIRVNAHGAYQAMLDVVEDLTKDRDEEGKNTPAVVEAPVLFKNTLSIATASQLLTQRMAACLQSGYDLNQAERYVLNEMDNNFESALSNSDMGFVKNGDMGVSEPNKTYRVRAMEGSRDAIVYLPTMPDGSSTLEWIKNNREHVRQRAIMNHRAVLKHFNVNEPR